MVHPKNSSGINEKQKPKAGLQYSQPIYIEYSNIHSYEQMTSTYNHTTRHTRYNKPIVHIEFHQGICIG